MYKWYHVTGKQGVNMAFVQKTIHDVVVVNGCGSRGNDVVVPSFIEEEALINLHNIKWFGELFL